MHPEPFIFKGLEEILKHRSPSLKGLFWITETSFLDIPKGFIPIDYVLDGLLVKNFRHLKELAVKEGSGNSQARRIHLFTTPYFQDSLFVVHLWYLKGKTEEDLSALLDMVFPREATSPELAEQNLSRKHEILMIHELDEIGAKDEVLAAVGKIQRNFHGHKENKFHCHFTTLDFKTLN